MIDCEAQWLVCGGVVDGSLASVAEPACGVDFAAFGFECCAFTSPRPTCCGHAVTSLSCPKLPVVLVGNVTLVFIRRNIFGYAKERDWFTLKVFDGLACGVVLRFTVCGGVVVAVLSGGDDCYGAHVYSLVNPVRLRSECFVCRDHVVEACVQVACEAERVDERLMLRNNAE